MRTKYFLATIILLILVHLRSIAGELINIRDLSSLKPTITVIVTDKQAEALKANKQSGASQILGLYLVINDTAATLPVSGTYSVDGRKLSFTPAYPLGEGLEFEVQYQAGQTIARKRITITRKMKSPTAQVVTAYPLSDTIPYNTLFFHVRFDRPMNQDVEAYKYIKMYDDNGIERTKAWRQRSFWLDDGKLLVLMIHPGRVKRGIHHDGPLFDSGKFYRLHVDKAIKDADGNPIKAEYTKTYYIGGEDHDLPKAAINYKKLPESKTAAPVLLSFSEGMDHASVIDGTSLSTAEGVHVPCTIETSGGDKNYRITPLNKWKKGKYTLTLKSSVYDFAANRINRHFEIKQTQDIEKDNILTTFDFEIE